MIKAVSLVDYLKGSGYKFYAGVPCSMLRQMLQAITNDREIKYIPAVRENAALGVASGAYLSGKRACVLMQNSGLGNVVNALTSFNMIYKIPVLMIVSWRGFKGKDAPEHMIMGKKMLPMLRSLGTPYRVLTNRYKRDIKWALDQMDAREIPVVLILKGGLIG